MARATVTISREAVCERRVNKRDLPKSGPVESFRKNDRGRLGKPPRLQPFMKGSVFPYPFPSQLFVSAMDRVIVDMRRTFYPLRMPLQYFHTRSSQGRKKPLSKEVRMNSGNA